jgi:hypothetical protein
MAAIPTSTNSFRCRPTTRPEEAGGDPRKDAAIGPREINQCADLGVRFSQWRRPAGGESSLGKIAGFPYTGPFEDITLKNT